MLYIHTYRKPFSHHQFSIPFTQLIASDYSSLNRYTCTVFNSQVGMRYEAIYPSHLLLSPIHYIHSFHLTIEFGSTPLLENVKIEYVYCLET